MNVLDIALIFSIAILITIPLGSIIIVSVEFEDYKSKKQIIFDLIPYFLFVKFCIKQFKKFKKHWMSI